MKCIYAKFAVYPSPLRMRKRQNACCTWQCLGEEEAQHSLEQEHDNNAKVCIDTSCNESYLAADDGVVDRVLTVVACIGWF